MKDCLILGIESSCDETAVAIVKNETTLLANVVSSQIDIHKRFGGVIPEVASRLHIEQISLVLEQALQQANVSMEEITAIAFTQGPGLIGSLHVGVQAAKTLAWAFQKPLVPVHHIAGHIYANAFVKKLAYPMLALVVSGGHTELVYIPKEYQFEVLGSTLDDAIGEAYDKVGRVLGLPYPGGVHIDKIAKQGNANIEFKKPKVEGTYDFSFSGLKSSVLQHIQRCDRKNESYRVEDIAASFQETAISILLEKMEKAIQNYHPKMVVLAGGVAANSRLREKIENDVAQKYKATDFVIPPLSCCTDNAAMIAMVGSIAYRHNINCDYHVGAKCSMMLK